MKDRSRQFGIAMTMIFLGVTYPVFAAGTAIANKALNQTRPAVAYGDTDDRYLVVWLETDAAGHTGKIYGRFAKSNGTADGSEFLIYSDSKALYAPRVAHNSADNEFMVIWQYGYSGSDHDIYGQRLSGSGSTLGSVLGIATSTDYEREPDVVFDADQEQYLVVWSDIQGSITCDFCKTGIRGKLLSGTGTGVANVTVATTNTSEKVRFPALAYNSGSEEYLVTWQESTFTSVAIDISGQRLNHNGAIAGPRIQISNAPHRQMFPRLAYNDTDDEFLVVWEDHRWGWGNDSDIYGQRLDTGGTLLGGDFQIAGTGTKLRFAPDVAFDSIYGEYAVTYEYEFSPTDTDVYRRRVLNSGSLPDSEVPIAELTVHEWRPMLAADGGGFFLYVWEDGQNYTTMGVDIYMTRQ